MHRSGISIKLDIYKISFIMLIFIGLFNTSQYAATFSWILVPSALLLLECLVSRKKIKLLSMHVIAVLFWIVFVISTALSDVVELQRDLVTFFLFVILFVLLTGNLKVREVAKSVVRTYIIVGLLGVLNILINYLSGHYYNAWFQRSTIVFLGVSRDPNYVGAFLAPVPILLLLMLSKKTEKKFVLGSIISIILTFVALVVVGSRGALISAIIPLFLYFLFEIKNIKTRIAVLTLCVVVVVIGFHFAVTYLPPQTVERLLFHQSADTRSDLWKAALNGFWLNPIIGKGMASASYFSNLGAGNHSHNMYIDILSGSGIVGAVLYLILLWLAIKGNGKMTGKKVLLSISFHLPMFFLNGFNSLTMWIPIIMSYVFSFVETTGSFCDNSIRRGEK